MSTEYNVGDPIAEFLTHCGVATAVGGVSIHNIAMLDGIGRRNAIRFATARGELGAGHMADGYARDRQGNMVTIVMNDRGYGVIKHIQDALCGGRNYFADLTDPDLGELADVAGTPLWRVQRPDDLGSAVEQALASRGPTLVELDMKAIGEVPPYHPFNKPQVAPGRP